MERDRQPRLRPFERVRHVGRMVFDHMSAPSDPITDHYRASEQRDVGKSARSASDVQRVIEGLRVAQPVKMQVTFDNPDVVV